MDLEPLQLQALLACVDEGTMEAAASRLQVTPSAVSQRIRALEQRWGRVVLQRTRPLRATADGEPLVRAARQLAVITAQVREELHPSGRAWTTLPLAVNADSLATWFSDVLGAVAEEGGIGLELHVEDEDFSAGLLQRGQVLGAVTARPVVAQGSSTTPLGSMRYLPVLARTLADRWLPQGRDRPDAETLSGLPMVTFDEQDDLQHRVLAAMGHPALRPPVHQVPSSHDFAAAVAAGLGWSALPEQQATTALADGALVPLPGAPPLDVALHWQRWRLASPPLDRVGELVRQAAGVHLRR